MKANQSNKERIARVITGLTLLKSSKSAKTKLLALVPIITGATGYCPAKAKLKQNQCATSGCCKHHHEHTDSETAKTA